MSNKIKKISNIEPSKGIYKVSLEKEDVINSYVNRWVMEWCKKYHPEAFEEARKFVMENLIE